MANEHNTKGIVEIRQQSQLLDLMSQNISHKICVRGVDHILSFSLESFPTTILSQATALEHDVI